MLNRRRIETSRVQRPLDRCATPGKRLGKNREVLQIVDAGIAVPHVVRRDPVASAPFNWPDGKWTALRLRIEPKGKDAWVIEGKAWPHGQPEPAEWMLHADATEAPPSGKASVWGSDYSEQPIRFDDLSVTTVKG